MKYIAMIQARCGSIRYPNKVLADLAGKPDLQRVIERVQQSKYIDEVIVITSIDKNNLPLIKLCCDLSVRVFIGSEEDVLDRYYQAARLLKPDYIIRITADCPVIDWRYIDLAIEEMNPETDYISDIDETFPDGLDLEILKYESLKTSWKESTLQSEREHVTLYIKNHPELFNIQKFRCPIEGISDYRWTLDEESDYKLLSIIFDYFVNIENEHFVTEDILEFLDKNPELKDINSNITRNEGLLKSLKSDYVVNVGQ